MRCTESRLAAKPPEGLGIDAAAQHLTLAVRRGNADEVAGPADGRGRLAPFPGKGGGMG
jgi:hypothetical protein